MTSMRILRSACAEGNLFGAPNLSAGALFRLLLVAFLVAFSSVALAQESGAQPEAGAATGAEGASQADAAPALPPQAFPEEQARIDAWRATLERVERGLQAERIDDVTLSDLRRQLGTIPMHAAGLKAKLQPRLQAVNQRVEQLKPADEQAARSQAEAIKLEHAQLQAEAAGLQGIVQQADFIALRAQQNIDIIGERRRALFTSSILQRSQSLADPSFWFDLAAATPETLANQSGVVGHWFGALIERTGRSAAGVLVVVIGFAAFLLSPGRRWLTRRTSRDPSVLHPSGLARATAAAAITLANLLIPAIAFGRFAALQIVFTTAVLMSLVLLLRLADEAISYGFSVQTRIGGFMRQAIGFKPNTISQIGVILAGFARLVVIMIAIMALLAPWGIQSEDVVGTFASAFFGFEIGGFSFSPSAILGAIVVFIIVIVATRGFQRWLDGRLLPQTSLDAGLRTSIHTGVGYVGAAIAGLVAFSYAGLNLQNVAIVASALSVGIGFGLQSIVNNFVSGIILLAERPFKVGDRIEVGQNMGIVQRVSVRATQIQTFDNVTVIVPNADLISGQVVNWMHGDFSARLKIPVGVSYDSDPEQVRRVLLEIAMDNPRVLKIPEPFVSFTDFGADALQFTLFCHVGNINADAGAASDMRFEIARRFRWPSRDAGPSIFSAGANAREAPEECRRGRRRMSMKGSSG